MSIKAAIQDLGANLKHSADLAFNCLTHPASHAERVEARIEDIRKNKFESGNPLLFTNGIEELTDLIRDDLLKGNYSSLSSQELLKAFNQIGAFYENLPQGSVEKKLVGEEINKLNTIAKLFSDEITSIVIDRFSLSGTSDKADPFILGLIEMEGLSSLPGWENPMTRAKQDFALKIQLDRWDAARSNEIFADSDNIVDSMRVLFTRDASTLHRNPPTQRLNWSSIQEKVISDIRSTQQESRSDMLACYQLLLQVNTGLGLSVFGVNKLNQVLQKLPSEYLDMRYGKDLIQHARQRASDLSGDGELPYANPTVSL